MARQRQVPDDPRKWEKAVSAAYLRSIGYTLEKAAKGAGMGVRTLIRWEQSEWWPRAVWEAHQRWLSGIVCGAKGAIVDGLRDHEEKAVMGRWVAERTIAELFPPRKLHEVTGKGGGPIQTESTGVDLKKLNDDELADLKRLACKAVADDNGD